MCRLEEPLVTLAMLFNFDTTFYGFDVRDTTTLVHRGLQNQQNRALRHICSIVFVKHMLILLFSPSEQVWTGSSEEWGSCGTLRKHLFFFFFFFFLLFGDDLSLFVFFTQRPEYLVFTIRFGA